MEGRRNRRRNKNKNAVWIEYDGMMCLVTKTKLNKVIELRKPKSKHMSSKRNNNSSKPSRFKKKEMTFISHALWDKYPEGSRTYDERWSMFIRNNVGYVIENFIHDEVGYWINLRTYISRMHAFIKYDHNKVEVPFSYFDSHRIDGRVFDLPNNICKDKFPVVIGWNDIISHYNRPGMYHDLSSYSAAASFQGMIFGSAYVDARIVGVIDKFTDELLYILRDVYKIMKLWLSRDIAYKILGMVGRINLEYGSAGYRDVTEFNRCASRPAKVEKQLTSFFMHYGNTEMQEWRMLSSMCATPPIKNYAEVVISQVMIGCGRKLDVDGINFRVLSILSANYVSVGYRPVVMTSDNRTKKDFSKFKGSGIIFNIVDQYDLEMLLLRIYEGANLIFTDIPLAVLRVLAIPGMIKIKAPTGKIFYPSQSLGS
jgi:hypothetical protein